jgi:ribosomal protein S18 acetylase RimI-like enzyme
MTEAERSGLFLRFRRATALDLGSLVALINAAYRGERSRLGWTTEADLVGGQRTDCGLLEELISDPNAYLVALESGGKVVGTVLVEDQGGCAYVGQLAVLPELQGRGYGRALLEHAEAIASGVFRQSRVRLHVLAVRGELIAFYERRGYVRTGARAAFPYGNSRYGEPKRADLEHVVLEKRLT